MICRICGESIDLGDLTQVVYHETHRPIAVIEDSDGNPIGGTPMSCTPEDHVSIERDLTVWDTLPILGLQEVVADENGQDAHWLDLRNCPVCGTTLARRIAP